MPSNSLGVIVHPVATRAPCPQPAPPYEVPPRERNACLGLLGVVVVAAGVVVYLGVMAL